MAAPPSKYPRFWGSNGFLRKKIPKKTSLAFDYTRPYMPPRCYFHSDIPPGPSNTKKNALKKPQGGRRGRDRPRRAIAYFFFIHWRKTISPAPWARGCIRHATVAFCLLVHRFGMISVGLHARDFFSKLDPRNRGILRGAPPHLHKSEATVTENTHNIS